MEDEKLNAELGAATEQKPAGRTALAEAYRASHPDVTEEPDDESLFGFANDRHAELDGKYGRLNDANQRLSELVAKDPKLAAALSMIAGDEPKSLPYAIGSIYGKEPFEANDLEEFERGYQENLTRLAESEKERQKALENIQAYETALRQYGRDNGLAEEQVSAVHDGIMQLADNILNGIIDVPVMDMVYKGLNYEKDVQEAADTGFVEGRNDKIDAKLKQPEEAPAVPDLRHASGAGGRKPAKKPARLSDVNEFENAKTIPGTAPAQRRVF
ncbi:MAG: hypothetical protein LBK22_06060 [Tannerella sp.]|jgi:hypothetical protein|nr:hypothetical protein [Tannerella sp.]